MIEGLDDLLERKNQPGIVELSALLQELLGGPSVNARVIDEQKLLRTRVSRLTFEIDNVFRSLVVKRFSLDRANREQLVVRRWLPAVGLAQNGPPLLGVAAERTGKCVWHVYQDLGDCMLFHNEFDSLRVRKAVDLIAEIHTRFAEHALLGECRSVGGDLGLYFYMSCVRDAIRSLESLCSLSIKLSSDQKTLRDSLLDRMNKLLDEQPHRAQAIAKFGGAETLLHGDLWTTNILVRSTDNGLQACLIDWDHVGVGPVYYDLSAFLLRFPVYERLSILKCYQNSVSWRLPIPSKLNLLFDTAESARLANSVIWPAMEARESQAEWAFEELAKIDGWFEQMQPVLPLNEGCENA